MIISSDFLKLEYLVPNPQCTIVDGEVIDWFDQRPQPTQEELDAVSTPEIDAVIEQEENELSFKGALVKLAKATWNQENRIRVLEGKPEVTLRQFIQAVKGL
jgi:hypothetical protein